MPLDTVEVAKRKAIARHGKAKVAYAEELKDVDECFNFYHGEGIFSRSDSAKLKSENRPALEINLVKPAVNLILGIERETQQMMRVYAEHSEDVILAAALDSLGNHSWYHFQGADRRAEMFADGVVGRRGHIMLYPEYRHGVVELKAISLDPRECLPDPDCRQYDPDEDASFFTLERYFAPADLESMFPDDATEIRSLHEQLRQNRPVTEYGRSAHRRLPGEDYLRDPRQHYDMARDRLEVIEQFPRRHANVYRLIDPISDYHEDFESRSDAEGALEDAWRTVPQIGSRMYIERISTTKVDRIVIIGGHIVPKDGYGEQPGPDDLGFRIVTFRAHHLGGRTSSVVDDLIDPTRQYNKTYSNLLHILTSTANSGWMVPTQSLIEENFFKDHGAETGLEIRYRAPFEPKKIMPTVPPVAQMMDMDIGVSMVDRISGTPDALRGVAPANIESGYGVERLQNYGLAVLGVLYGNLIRSERSFYTKNLKMVTHFMPLPDEVEILGNKLTERLSNIAPEEAVAAAGDQKFLRLSALGGINKISNFRYRVRTERGPVLRTQREYWLNTALQIGSILPPGSIPPDLILELVDHPEADRILENIKSNEEAMMMQQGMQQGAQMAAQVGGA